MCCAPLLSLHSKVLIYNIFLLLYKNNFEQNIQVICVHLIVVWWTKNDIAMVGQRYQCPKQCSRINKLLQGVRQHLCYRCGVLPKFVCSVCLKYFSYTNQLKIHTAAVHNTLLTS